MYACPSALVDLFGSVGLGQSVMLLTIRNPR
jgi:hypothetical protein